jgi:hypothetical protein
LPTQNTAAKRPSQPWPGSSSQAHVRASTTTPRRAASARVRWIIAGLASVAVASKPRSARPTASSPVPAEQSSTGAPAGSASVSGANAATAPSGSSSGSGTSQW